MLVPLWIAHGLPPPAKWTLTQWSGLFIFAVGAPLGLVEAGTAASAVYHSAGQLTRSRAKDEQRNELLEYKDKTRACSFEEGLGCFWNSSDK